MQPTGRKPLTDINQTKIEPANRKLKRTPSAASLERIENDIMDLIQSVAELKQMQLEQLKKEKKK